MFIAFNLIGAVQAENIYKVYNKNENKTYNLTLGAVKFIADQYYIFAMFKNNKPYCVLDGELNRKNQLIGGKCTEYCAALRYYRSNGQFDVTPYEYGWREINGNTFLNEAYVIKANKAHQGYQLVAPKILEKINEY